MNEPLESNQQQPHQQPSDEQLTSQRRWVLLRGLGRDSRHWGEFVAILSEVLPNDEFICIDLPGFGRARNFKTPASIEKTVDFARTQCEELLQKGPIHLLAISLGGMVAADWMARYPQEIERAVLINSSSRLNTMAERIQPKALAQLLYAMLFSRLFRQPKLLEKRVAFWVINREEKRSMLSEYWAGFYPQGKISLSAIAKQLLAASQFKPQRLPHPLLLLRADGDRLVNPACSERLYQFWQTNNGKVTLVTHKDGGHDLPEDAPTWVAKQVARWLEDL